MGAWDVGPFDNDAALDWLDDLAEQLDDDPWGAIRAVLAGTLGAGGAWVDAEDACEGLAAAELVAAAAGRPRPGLDPEEGVGALVSALPPLPLGVVAEAVVAVEAALSESSELRELWEEGDAGAAWLAETRALLDRLRAAC